MASKKEINKVDEELIFYTRRAFIRNLTASQFSLLLYRDTVLMCTSQSTDDQKHETARNNRLYELWVPFSRIKSLSHAKMNLHRLLYSKENDKILFVSVVTIEPSS